jgi:WD40 repeat protein
MFRTKLSAAVIAILVATACTTEDASAPSGEPKDPQKRSIGEREEPSELLYVKGSSLFVYDLDSGRRRRVAELPSADVAVSPDGKKYAVVEETSPAGSTAEGFRKPVLQLGSLDRQGTRELGPGRSPLWSPDGKYVAAIAKAKGVFSCDARSGDPRKRKACQETEVVVAYSAARTDRPRIALGADRWSMIGWTAEGQILATSLIFQNVVLGYPGASSEEAETLNLEPSEVWGVSPSEYTLLVVRDGRTFFASPGVGEGATVDLDGALLGDGAWAPDGRKVVAVAIQQRAHGSPRSEVVLLDVATGKVEAVPRSKNAQSAAVWSQGSDFFAYVRVDPARAHKLQAVLCSTEFDCDTLFSWGQGVALLALT